jgi:hypothetical protein
MDEQRSLKEGCGGYSRDDGDSGEGRGFYEAQGVKGMPPLHVDRNNRFATLEVEEADKSVLNQAMPTDSPTAESPIKP